MLITYINCCAHNSKRSYSGSRYCAMEFKKQKMGKQRKKGEKEKKWFFPMYSDVRSIYVALKE